MLIGKNPVNRRSLGMHLIEAELSLEQFNSPYARVVVKDINGRRAWSNPFFFDDNPKS
jgi:hypothetical protein